jgi:hypothetical protein
MNEKKKELSEEEKKLGIEQLRNFGKLLNIGRNVIQRNFELDKTFIYFFPKLVF